MSVNYKEFEEKLVDSLIDLGSIERFSISEIEKTE
jgi:hypothetical protein